MTVAHATYGPCTVERNLMGIAVELSPTTKQGRKQLASDFGHFPNLLESNPRNIDIYYVPVQPNP